MTTQRAHPQMTHKISFKFPSHLPRALSNLPQLSLSFEQKRNMTELQVENLTSTHTW